MSMSVPAWVLWLAFLVPTPTGHTLHYEVRQADDRTRCMALEATVESREHPFAAHCLLVAQFPHRSRVMARLADSGASS